ncbi:MAG: Excinuclease subunit domain protein [Microbacteriaceae bacterium]|nr:Excinuclease subunit domain protein [Microbacteriaceae bacterium]
MPWVYMLKCSDESYYTGSTLDLARRLVEHDLGEGANFTRSRRPVTLVFAEEFDRIEEAFAREKQLQGWSRAKKEALIAGRWAELQLLSQRLGYSVGPFESLRDR